MEAQGALLARVLAKRLKGIQRVLPTQGRQARRLKGLSRVLAGGLHGHSRGSQRDFQELGKDTQRAPIKNG